MGWRNSVVLSIAALMLPASVSAQGLPERYSEAGVAFDTSKLPAASGSAGEFPFLTPPDGYHTINNPGVRDLDRFPFWTAKGFHNVEGRLFMAYIRAVPGKTYSVYELSKGIADQVTAMGGVKVAQGQIPNGIAHSMPTEVFADKSVGLGDIFNHPVTTYVIRKGGGGGTIWISVCSSGSGASWAIMEEGGG